MYDIKTIEFGQQQQQLQQLQQQQQNHQQQTIKTEATTAYSGSSSGKHSNNYNNNNINDSSSPCSISEKVNASTAHCRNPAESTHMTLLSLRRRRLLQRHTCLLSILAAFVFGLALGVFMPMFGLSNIFAMTLTPSSEVSSSGSLGSSNSDNGGSMHTLPIAEGLKLNNNGGSSNSRRHSSSSSGSGDSSVVAPLNRTRLLAHPPSDFPTIYELRAGGALPITSASAAASDIAEVAVAAEKPYSVAFIRERDVELPAQEALRDAFHVEQDRSAPDALLVQRLDASDGSVREFRMQRIAEGRFRKGPERKLSKLATATNNSSNANDSMENPSENMEFVPLAQRIVQNARNARNQRNHGIIKNDIYWGDLVERAMPSGFDMSDNDAWNRYVTGEGIVERLEPGCGRMQNRMVIFTDGTRACARYRQNTDQIQGELFSFYLGQLLNLTNLAPSAASVVDLEKPTWSTALVDITQAQWKHQRPVVLTRWLPDLEPAGIPQPFRPLERHLNKYDVWNITLGATAETLAGGEVQPSSLLKRLDVPKSASKSKSKPSSQSPASGTPSPVLQRLIELAQWSDLIIFDYLIANLDRVVNNLYNYQWNADIMAAPAHNLARKPDTQLLVFLDNESGLLHGYRLLKKYEAYHGLLLDNLCVFRQSTIEALRQLRAHGVGQRLRELFEQTTSTALRDVLPTLPDKSIKILVDRIDRVLGQVQKCSDLLADS